MEVTYMAEGIPAGKLTLFVRVFAQDGNSTNKVPIGNLRVTANRIPTQPGDIPVESRTDLKGECRLEIDPSVSYSIQPASFLDGQPQPNTQTVELGKPTTMEFTFGLDCKITPSLSPSKDTTYKYFTSGS